MPPPLFYSTPNFFPDSKSPLVYHLFFKFFVPNTYYAISCSYCLNHVANVTILRIIFFVAGNSEEEFPANACTIVTLLGKSMGFTKVTVTHKYDTADGKTVRISDRITIAVLDPLLPVQPISGKTGKKSVLEQD